MENSPLFLKPSSLVLLLILSLSMSGCSGSCSRDLRDNIFDFMGKISDHSYTQQTLSKARRELAKSLSSCPTIGKGFYASMYGFMAPAYIDILANDLDRLKLDIQKPIPHRPGDVYFTPLHFAASFGTADAMILLLKSGIAVNAADSMGNTALMGAIESPIAPFRKVKILIRSGADPNTHANRVWTPLGSAIVKGKYKIADYLIEHGGCLSFGAYKAKPSEINRARKNLGRDIKELACYSR